MDKVENSQVDGASNFAAMCADWHRQYDDVNAAFEKANAVIDTFGGFPDLPECLKEPIAASDGTTETPQDQWFKRDLETIIARRGLLFCDCRELQGRIVMETYVKPLTEAALVRVKELLEACEAYDRARDDHLARCRAVEDIPGELNRLAWDRAMELMRTPVHSLEDVAQKVLIANRLEMLCSRGDDVDTAVWRVFTEVARIAGAAA